MSSSNLITSFPQHPLVQRTQQPQLPSGPATPITPPRYYTQAIGEDGGLPWNLY